MVWLSVILGLMSSVLLPRVCAFGVPGQGKTHGHSGFENDFEDLETDLLAAFVSNGVSAEFCAPEVFVDAAMIASDIGDLMLGAALSAFEEAAMLRFQKSEWNGETGASYLNKKERVWGRFLGLSGVCGCCYRAGWCLGCCLVVAKARAASVELFVMRLRHAAAAFVAAFQIHNFDCFRVAPEAPACEYLCNVKDLHAAAATAAALGWDFHFHSSLGRRVRVCFIGFCLDLALWNCRTLCWNLESIWCAKRFWKSFFKSFGQQGSYIKTSKDLRNPQTFRL